MRVTFFDNSPELSEGSGKARKRCEIGLFVIDGVWGYGLGEPANRLAIGRVAG
jgi:hypothetical protein